MPRPADNQPSEPSASLAGISRRTFLGGCAAAAVVAAGGGAVFVERRDTFSPALREVVIPVAGLTRELSLVQATDLHAIRFGDAQSEIAALLTGRKIDAAVMTGDILDESVDSRQPGYDLADILLALTPRVYFLPGNHDPEDLGADLSRRGVIPLQNATPVSIDPADPAGREAALVYPQQP